MDQLAARIRGEALPAPKRPDSQQRQQSNGPSLESLAIFLFVVVPIAGAMFTRMMGRKLGSLVTGGIAGGIGWWLTASALLAGVAGLVAIVLVGVFGVGSARRGGGSGGVPPIIWGGGGGGGASGGWGGPEGWRRRGWIQLRRRPGILVEAGGASGGW